MDELTDLELVSKLPHYPLWEAAIHRSGKTKTYKEIAKLMSTSEKRLRGLVEGDPGRVCFLNDVEKAKDILDAPSLEWLAFSPEPSVSNETVGAIFDELQGIASLLEVRRRRKHDEFGRPAGNHERFAHEQAQAKALYLATTAFAYAALVAEKDEQMTAVGT